MVHQRSTAPVLRGCLLLAAVAGALVLAGRLAAAPLAALLDPVRRTGPHALTRLPFDVVVTGVFAAALLACASWCTVAVVLGVASSVARSVHPRAAITRTLTRACDRTSPVVLRTLVAGVLGAAVGAGVTGPAVAGPTRTPAGHAGSSAGSSAGSDAGSSAGPDAGSLALVGLAVPDRTTGARRAGSPVGSGPTTVHHLRAVVRRGDSLWSLAAAELRRSTGGTPSPAQVTTAWHRLYAANRVRVGADPDLLLPGTSLVVPDLVTTERKDRP